MSARIVDIVIFELLGAYFGKPAPDRMIDELLYDDVPPGASGRNYTVKLFLSPARLIHAALTIKAKGPPHLAAHSLSQIKMALRKFLYRNYPIVWRELQREVFDGSVFDAISPECRSRVADALEKSSIFTPHTRSIAFPITPIEMKSDFTCGSFFLIDLHSLTEGDANWLRRKYLDGADVGGWLIVKAPSIEAAKRDKRVILGALALALNQQHRHGFTLRKVAKSFLQFPDPHTISVSSSEPHTPPIGRPITIEESDHAWLNLLPHILARSTTQSKRHAKALEYYYRAWFMDESDRCFLLFMALDAIFGQGGKGFSVGMKDGIYNTLNEKLDPKRLDALLRIRNTMLHGGAPDIFASSNYLDYATRYYIDPSTDIQLLASKCLRLHIFGSAFRPQENPDIELLGFARTRGLIPNNYVENSIVLE